MAMKPASPIPARNNNMPATIAKDLQMGDRIKSSTGKWLTVRSTNHTENKVIITFVSGEEIDFRHHDKILEADLFKDKG